MSTLQNIIFKGTGQLTRARSSARINSRKHWKEAKEQQPECDPAESNTKLPYQHPYALALHA
jgi:hypothetical protein